MMMESVLEAIAARDGESFAALLDPECAFVAPGVELHGPDAAWAWMTRSPTRSPTSSTTSSRPS